MVPQPRAPEPLPGVETSWERRTMGRRGRPSVSSLSSVIDPELLRAVPMKRVLMGCGSSWTRDQDKYNLSQKVEKIDAFLSHDWGTSRWLKTTTLLVSLNSVPAALASLLMCALMCVLLICNILQGWLPAILAVHGTFWCVFLFWQNLRELYQQYMVFLDRLCIAQHDPQSKKEGILALGGFLSKSDRLVVLWSPRYFTRLWTAFELAAFLRHDQAKAQEIEFAPASMGPLLLYFHGFEVLLVSSFHLMMMQFLETLAREENKLEEQESLWHFAVAMLVICAPAFFVVAPVVLYLGTMQMKALLQLGKQVKDFRIRDAQCSCCEMLHCHPETGDEMLCDRELVFQTLKRWFPNEESSDAHLDRFDDLVHQRLGGFVAQILGSGAPPLKYILAITIHPLLGFLCHYVYLAKHDYFGFTALGWMIGWFQAPPMVYLAFWEFLMCWRMGARFGDRCPVWLILLLGMAAGITFNVALWLQYSIMKYMFGYDFNWPVVGSLALMWVAFLIPYIWEYSPSLLKRKGETPRFSNSRSNL